MNPPSRLPSPVATLTPTPWAGNADLRRVYQILNDGDGGASPQTLLVGGCVRNAVRGLAIADYDLATRLSCDDVIARAGAAGLHAVPTGIDHGTVTVVAGGRGFEVTRLRYDIETDGRRAVVDFSDDWAVDAARRDFTMNTLYADLDGHIYEFIPGAYDDARAGRVRFVGDASARVAEDYLRILRFFRFHAWYGQGEMDAGGLTACAVMADNLRQLSKERISAEIKKWLAAECPEKTIRISFENNILNALLDLKPDYGWLSNLVAIQQAAGQVDVLARLAVLCDFCPEKLTPYMSFSNKEIKYLENISNLKLEDVNDPAALCRDLVRQGREVVLARALIDYAKTGQGLPEFWPDIAAWPIPEFPMTGHDLIAAGVPAGPELGRTLAALTEKWVRSDFTLGKDDLIAAIKF